MVPNEDYYDYNDYYGDGGRDDSIDLIFQGDNRYENVCLGKFNKMDSSRYSIHINHLVKLTVGIVYRYRQHQTDTFFEETFFSMRQHQTDEFCLVMKICRLLQKVIRLILSIPIYSSG